MTAADRDAGRSGGWDVHVDVVDAGDFIDTEVEPYEASALLALTATATRAVLAQVCSLHFARDDQPPPLSLPRSQFHLVKPLLEAGWLERCDAEQRLFNGDIWGEVPEGMMAVALSWKGIGAVLALLSGTPEIGGEWLGRDPADLRRLSGDLPPGMPRRLRMQSGLRRRTVW